MRKINIALIISVLIFFVSVIGFIFNTSVRITPRQDMIIVDENIVDEDQPDSSIDIGFLLILVGIPLVAKLFAGLFDDMI